VLKSAHIWELRVPNDELPGGIILPETTYKEDEPDWIIDPVENVAYPIAKETIPAEYLPGTDIIHKHEHEALHKLEGSGPCPECGEQVVFHGYLLDAAPPVPNAVMQCQKCHALLWMELYRRPDNG
jgi:hypothetical protein